MLKRLTILAASVIMTVPIVAAAAPTVEVKKETTEQKAVRMVNACRQGYAEYRYGKISAKEALNNTLMKFPAEERPAVALICLGYGEGYEDGIRGVV